MQEYEVFLEVCRNKLQNTMPEWRYEHCVRVAQTAAQYAARHGCSMEKAYIAGLLHDCAKGYSPQDILAMAIALGLNISDALREMPEDMLHGQVGAYVAAKDYGIEDKEILQAIFRHQSGAEDMTDLDNIVRLADMTEPGRSSAVARHMRELADTSIEDALFIGLCEFIPKLIEKGLYLEPMTAAYYNQMIYQRKMDKGKQDNAPI